MSELPVTRPPGRPRQPEVDEAVIQATLELLAGVSYSDLSIEMIAKRAGVGKPTIYRRWASKLDLVADAYGRVSDFGPIEVPEGGDLKKAIRTTLVGAYRRVAEAGLGHVVPSLVGEMALHHESAGRFAAKHVVPRRALFLDALRRAVGEGLLRPDTDVELMHDLLAGHALLRSFQSPWNGVDPLEEKAVGSAFDKVWDLFSREPARPRRSRVGQLVSLESRPRRH